ncbi:hypothetical protein ABEB36_014113 [Hypothenemus hampei]|uniref:THAP-type domain-containing protein n=1 Tax=Hypothenemus hampei TaxID=57062 RepID=A0ABD1E493_HYPHA
MVRQCVVCHKVQKVGENILQSEKITFHRKEWFSILGLDKRYISEKSEVCSEHFNPEDLENKPSGRRLLKKGVIPKVFNQDICNFFRQISEELDIHESNTFTGTSLTESPPSKKFKNRPSSSSSITATASEAELFVEQSKLKQKKIRYAGDLSSGDFSSPTKIKKTKFRILRTTIQNQRKTIKQLQQKNRRLNQKVTNLKSLVQLLKSKSFLNDDSAAIENFRFVI